jgi:signal peptidase
MAAICVFGTLVVLAIGPRIIGYSSFVVYGGSMEPTVPKGSVAVGQPVQPNDIEVGDVIVYKVPGSSLPTLHRVVELDESGGVVRARTKGDANEAHDPTEVLLTGQGSRLVYSVPYIGYILHAPRSAWSENLFLRLPALALAAFVLWSIWKPERKARLQPVSVEAQPRRTYKPYA